MTRPSPAERGTAADASPPSEAVAPKPRWEERHRRWTFHVPIDVLEAIDAEAARSGRSKSSVAVHALRSGLGLDE